MQPSHLAKIRCLRGQLSSKWDRIDYLGCMQRLAKTVVYLGGCFPTGTEDFSLFLGERPIISHDIPTFCISAMCWLVSLVVARESESFKPTNTYNL